MQVRTPPVRPADGVVVVGLVFRPGDRLSCGLGLRPLIVSRVKCEGGPCRGHSAHPYAFDICWIWADVVA